MRKAALSLIVPCTAGLLLLGACSSESGSDDGTGGAQAGGAGGGATTGGSGGSTRTGGAGGGSAATGGGGGSSSGGAGGGSSNTGGSGGSSSGTGGSGGSGGSAGGSGGSSSTGGSGGARNDGGAVDARASVDAQAGDRGSPAGDMAPAGMGNFSFFYTSVDAMRRLSGSMNGFGGDLRFGMPTGLEGADKICQTIATDEGFGQKTWKAFLSVVRGPGGQPVHAIDRIGEGPWYDRRGRLIAMNKAGLTSGNRPAGNMQAVNDLVDEKGRGRPAQQPNDTHDVVTGSNTMGRLRYPNNTNATCNDWTSTTIRNTTIGFGHSWPAGSGMHWIQVHNGSNCAAGVNLVQNGGGNGSSIGAGGGWGGIYCFALQP